MKVPPVTRKFSIAILLLHQDRRLHCLMQRNTMRLREGEDELNWVGEVFVRNCSIGEVDVLYFADYALGR